MPSGKVGALFVLHRDQPAGESIDSTFAEFVSALFAKRAARSSSEGEDDGKKTPKNTPLFVPGRFANKERRNVYARAMTMAVVDIDGITEAAMVDKLRLLAARGVEFAFYTTWSSRPPEAISARVLMPLSRDIVRSPMEIDLCEKAAAKGSTKTTVPFAEWASFRRGLAEMLGDVDKQTHDAARQYYIPVNPDDGPEPRQGHFPGVELDVDAVIASAPPAETRHPSALRPLEERTRFFNHDDLKMLAKSLAKRHSTALPGIKAALAITKAEAQPYAGARGGHDMRLAMTMAMARAVPDAGVDVDLLRELFFHTFQMREHLHGKNAEDGFAKFVIAYEGGLRVAQREANDALILQEDEHLANVARAYRNNEVDRATELTAEEVDKIVRECGGKPGALSSSIIQHKNTYYFRVGTDICGRSFTRDEAENAASYMLAPLRPLGVATWSNVSGKRIRRAFPEIMKEYGCVAKEKVGSLCDSVTKYDVLNEELVISYAPRRKLDPEWSDAVDEFFRISYGRHYTAVLNWFTYIRDLQFPAVCLHLHGKSRSGKNLIVAASARMFHEGDATKVASAVHKHNDALLRCPLVHAEEKLPVQLQDTAKFREFVSSMEQAIEPKNHPIFSVRGALRLIVSSNKDTIFGTGESLSVDDIEAVGNRILPVRVADEAVVWLRERKDWVSRVFVKEEAVAKHLTFLRSQKSEEDVQRAINDGLIGGGDKEEAQRVARQTLVSSTKVRPVCEFIVRALLKHTMHGSSVTAVVVEDGAPLVCASDVTDQWERVFGNTFDRPDPIDINTALRTLSNSGLIERAGRVLYPVDTDNLAVYVQSTGRTTEANLRAIVARGGVTDPTSGSSVSQGNLVELKTPRLG